MTPEELRLECLKLVQQTANASGMLHTPGDIISRARAYADFVMERSGHGGVAKANGTQNLELALEAGFPSHAAPVSGFETGAFLGAAHAEQPGPPHGAKIGTPRRR